MAFDMSTVRSLYVKDNNIKLYKQVFTITNDEALHDINGDPISLLYTVYSTTQVQWTGTTTNSVDFYNFLISCGYKAVSNRIRIGFDNQKYVYYTYNNVGYPIQSSDCSNIANTRFSIYIYTGGSTYPKVPECSITGSGWTEVTFPEESPFMVKQYEYQRIASNTMTFLAIGNDLNGDYIKQYFIGTTAYPDVTITSVSGNTYTLSDGNSYTMSRRDEENTFSQYKEVIKIQDSNNIVIWEKPYIPQWHTLWSGSQNVRAYGGYQQSGSVTGNGVTLVNAANVLSNSVQVRITFNTYQLTATGGTAAITWLPSSHVSSPWTTTLSAKTSYTYLLGGEAQIKDSYGSAAQDAWVYLRYKLTNNQLSFNTTAGKNTNTVTSGKVNARIVITKIEAYY